MFGTERSVLPSTAVRVSSGGGGDVFPSLPPSLVGVARANHRRCRQYHVGDHTEWVSVNLHTSRDDLPFTERSTCTLTRPRPVIPIVSAPERRKFVVTYIIIYNHVVCCSWICQNNIFTCKYRFTSYQLVFSYLLSDVVSA